MRLNLGCGYSKVVLRKPRRGQQEAEEEEKMNLQVSEKIEFVTRNYLNNTSLGMSLIPQISIYQ